MANQIQPASLYERIEFLQNRIEELLGHIKHQQNQIDLMKPLIDELQTFTGINKQNLAPESPKLSRI